MFASIVTTLLSQVKAGKRSAHPRAFNFRGLSALVFISIRMMHPGIGTARPSDASFSSSPRCDEPKTDCFEPGLALWFLFRLPCETRRYRPPPESRCLRDRLLPRESTSACPNGWASGCPDAEHILALAGSWSAPRHVMKDLLRTRRNLLVRYGVAVVLACLALLIRGLIPIRPGIAIYQLALAAVVVSAWYGGRGPGLLALLISVAGILYWFIPPADSFALPAEYALSLILFLGNGVLLIEFSMGRWRAEQALEESEGRFRLMAETVPEVLWIESLDPPRLLYLSPSYDRIWGRPTEDLYRDRDWRLEAIH